MITIAKVDAALDRVDEDESPADELALLVDSAGDWMRSDDLEHKYALVESSGAVWYVHEDTISRATDCRRCATWDEARNYVPDGVQS